MIKIIGQEKTKTLVKDLENKGFPRFMIIVGAVGSEMDLIARYAAERLEANFVDVPIKADDVREAVRLAQTINDPTLYLFQDGQDMSSAAANALLKVTEETPNKAYFILTTNNLNAILPTLQSRAYVLQMDVYYPFELAEYAKLRDYAFPSEYKEYIFGVVRTPGDVDTIVEYDIPAFFEFVKKVINNIYTVTGANSLKIPKSLSFSAGQPGFHPVFFLRAIKVVINLVLMGKIDSSWLNEELSPKSNVRANGALSRVTAKTNYFLGQIENINGINVPNTIDAWILAIREVLQDELS